MSFYVSTDISVDISDDMSAECWSIVWADIAVKGAQISGDPTLFPCIIFGSRVEGWRTGKGKWVGAVVE